ncbi:MAG: lysophospholipid acyltransferase family protein [Nocardioidaceae bacterium]
MLYYVLHLVLKPLTRLLYRPVIEGTENVPAAGPVILASNHLSFIDSLVIPLVAPRRVAYLAKAEYFAGTGPLSRPRKALFTALGAIPVDRSAARSAQESLDAALAVLTAGQVFGIYPEGTRSRDGRLYRGRTGVAWLAFHSGAPVVPVGLLGTEAIMPVGSRVPRVRRVTVRFGTPLTFDALTGENPSGAARRIATDAVMDAIAELTGQPRAPGYNELPPSI